MRHATSGCKVGLGNSSCKISEKLTEGVDFRRHVRNKT